jgi:hypothetical protein
MRVQSIPVACFHLPLRASLRRKMEMPPNVVRVLLAGALLCVSGCASSRGKLPESEIFELGLSRASYRNYAHSKANICSAEVRWLLDELSSVNGLLGSFLDKTSAGYDGFWAKEQLDLLEDGARRLPELLDVHEKNLADLQKCRFARTRAFPDLTHRGTEYVRMARRRVEESPALVAYVRARAARELWSQERPRAELEARRTCPARPRPGAIELYYAWEDDQRQVQWLFCDGAKVRSAPDGQKDFVEPFGLSVKDRRKLRPKSYLDATERFDPARVDRAPLLPARGVEKAHSGEEPGFDPESTDI